MANINLSTEGTKEEPIKLNKGLVTLLILLGVVLLVYGGMLSYKAYINKSIKDTQQKYTNALGSLSDAEMKNILDFQNRMDVAKSLSLKDKNTREALEKVASVMSNGNFLASYEYEDGGMLTLIFAASDYESIAKQIVNLKGSDYFSNVKTGESKFDSQSNKIIFTVTLKIK